MIHVQVGRYDTGSKVTGPWYQSRGALAWSLRDGDGKGSMESLTCQIDIDGNILLSIGEAL